MTKKYYILILSLFLISNSYAWTLGGESRMSLYNNKVDIYIANNNCDNAGLTPARIESITKKSIEQFWNSVSTSSLRLKVKGIAPISTSGMSMDDFVDAPPANSILIGCLQDDELKELYGYAGFNCDGINCYSYVAINDADATLNGATSTTLKSFIAHEIGHAVGLGHSSEKHALMYYQDNGSIKRLSQDDIDGISWLYPNESEIGGLMGSCATVSFDDHDGGGGAGPGSGAKTFFLSFLFGLIMLGLFNKTLGYARK